MYGDRGRTMQVSLGLTPVFGGASPWMIVRRNESPVENRNHRSHPAGTRVTDNE